MDMKEKMSYETPAVEMQQVMLEQVIATSPNVGGGGAGTPGGGTTPRSVPDEGDSENWGVTER